MKIAVIGSVIRDYIEPYQSPPVESFGGIFYTILILSQLLDEDAEIYPICFTGADCDQQIREKLTPYSNIKLDGLQPLPQMHTAHHIIYQDQETRAEIETQPLPPLSRANIQLAFSCDALIINFITGRDLSFDAYQYLGAMALPLIYVDFHSLALAKDAQGQSFYRRPADWVDWVRPARILQMNQMEAMTLGDLTSDWTNPAYGVFGETILNYGVQIFNITLGSQGSLLFYRQDREVITQKIPGYPVSKVRDVTGCGDAFASGFIVDYFKKRDVGHAVAFANAIAALKTQFIGTENLYQIQKWLPQNHFEPDKFNLNAFASTMNA
ncbi:PfkB family carbohydrate kinase [candidate division KSB1 bacterium]|nr:PfkB family carbohydrate kinase [candidate division KSB1 bacterium]